MHHIKAVLSSYLVINQAYYSDYWIISKNLLGLSERSLTAFWGGKLRTCVAHESRLTTLLELSGSKKLIETSLHGHRNAIAFFYEDAKSMWAISELRTMPNCGQDPSYCIKVSLKIFPTRPFLVRLSDKVGFRDSRKCTNKTLALCESKWPKLGAVIGFEFSNRRKCNGAEF